MKELFDNPKEPIRIFRAADHDGKFVELVKTTGEKVYACGQCGTLHCSLANSFETAQNCCKQSYCECGEKKPQYWTRCDNCSTNKRLAEAEEILDNGEMVTVFDHDQFYTNMDELVEDLHESMEPDEPWPEWASPTEKLVWGGISEHNIESIIEDSLQDFHEEASEWIVDFDQLVTFINEWNKKQNIVSYQILAKKKVRIPPRPPFEEL